MSLILNHNQLVRELELMKQYKSLTWKDIISKRLSENLSAYKQDVDFMIKSLSSKKPLTIIRRF